jgi:serine O-acetyltransferase
MRANYVRRISSNIARDACHIVVPAKVRRPLRRDRQRSRRSSVHASRGTYIGGRSPDDVVAFETREQDRRDELAVAVQLAAAAQGPPIPFRNGLMLIAACAIGTEAPANSPSAIASSGAKTQAVVLLCWIDGCPALTASSLHEAATAWHRLRPDSCNANSFNNMRTHIAESLVNHNASDLPGSTAQTDEPRGRGRSLTPRWVSKARALDLPALSPSEVARFVHLVREDLKAHDGDWTRAGFQALLVYRFGVWRMSIRSRLWRAPLSVLWRALFAAVRNFYGIELPFTARIGRRVIFEHQHGIVVHGNAQIGDDCIIRQGVTLGIRRLDGLAEAPVLGRGVNVGAGAKLLGHIVVGDHAEIGANAVVLDDVPAHALAVGIPARLVTRKDVTRKATTTRQDGASRRDGRAVRRERSGRNITALPGTRASKPESARLTPLSSEPLEAAASSKATRSNGASSNGAGSNGSAPSGSASNGTGARVARARSN